MGNFLICADKMKECLYPEDKERPYNSLEETETLFDKRRRLGATSANEQYIIDDTDSYILYS